MAAYLLLFLVVAKIGSINGCVLLLDDVDEAIVDDERWWYASTKKSNLS